MDLVKGLLDINKIPAKIILLVGIISSALLFLPESTIQNIELMQFKEEYGKYFGIVFLSAISLLILNIFSGIYNRIQSINEKKKLDEKIKRSLKLLDPSEKAVLREFFIQQKYTLMIPFDNPTVSGLLNKGILSQVGSVGQNTSQGIKLPLGISDFALEKLNIDISILDLPLNEHTPKEEINRIRDSRPRWATEKTLLEQLNDLH